MSWRKQLVACVVVGFAWVGAAQAQVQTPGWFGEIDGMFASKVNGTGINPNNGVIGPLTTTPGSGGAFGGRLGFRFNNPWDVAFGVFHASLKDGPHLGPSPSNNDWSVTGARVLNIDGEVGYNMGFPWGGLRPFAGLRYHSERHEMGYHPDAPLGCCGNDTTGTGFGPRIGIDGSLHLVGPLSLIGGIDVAALFGHVDETGGPFVVSGTESRTIYNYGARVGLDFEFMPPWHLAAGYRVESSNGGFFTQEGFSPPGGVPSGSGTRTIQGPFAALKYNYGGAPH